MTGDPLTPGRRVLVVDDDAALTELLQVVLQASGFETEGVGRGDEVLDAVARFAPDVVLLDVMLPGLDGVSAARALRQVSDVPIIMLTACSETAEVVAGLEAGADDYIVKPFRTAELLARVRARLRRRGDEPPPAPLRIGDLVIDVGVRTVRRGDAHLALTPLEFDLLAALAARPRHVFTREELLQTVWGYQQGDTRLVNVHVQRLRAKVERNSDNPSIIITVRGLGYRAGEPQ